MGLELSINSPVGLALLIPRLGAESARGLPIKVHTLPVSIVPANFLAWGVVLPELLHFISDRLELLETSRFTELLPQESVLTKALMQKFEQMGSNATEISLTRVFLMHLKVLVTKDIHVVNTCRVVQGWILQDALTRHDTITPRHFQCFLYILEGRNSSIHNNRDLQCLLDLANHVVIGVHDSLLIVFLQAAVHCDERCAGCLNPFDEGHGQLLGWQASDLDRDGDVELSMKLLDHRNDQVGLLKQVRSIVALFSYTLRTTAIDVDCVTVVLDKLRRLN